MLLFVAFASLVAWAAGAPLVYDQRQEGELNVAADVQNIVFVVAIPQKSSLPLDFLDDFMKSNKKHNHESAQDRADHVMDAFVEPSTPYRVEIGSSDRDRSAEGGGRAVEVVIAGRRSVGNEPQNENDSEEIKLIGATEQCGPDRERDPVTLACRFRTVDAPLPAPAPEPQEVIPEQAPQVIAS